MLTQILIILLLILIDQISKFFIVIKLSINQSVTIIPNCIKITSIRNKGAALGILEGKRTFFIIISFLVLIIFFYLLINETVLFNILTYIFIISGTVGNLIDRIIRKEVVDFIDIIIFRYNLPIFNFADIFILFGFICFIFI